MIPGLESSPSTVPGTEWTLDHRVGFMNMDNKSTFPAERTGFFKEQWCPPHVAFGEL